VGGAPPAAVGVGSGGACVPKAGIPHGPAALLVVRSHGRSSLRCLDRLLRSI